MPMLVVRKIRRIFMQRYYSFLFRWKFSVSHSVFYGFFYEELSGLLIWKGRISLTFLRLQTSSFGLRTEIGLFCSARREHFSGGFMHSALWYVVPRLQRDPIENLRTSGDFGLHNSVNTVMFQFFCCHIFLWLRLCDLRLFLENMMPSNCFSAARVAFFVPLSPQQRQAFAHHCVSSMLCISVSLTDWFEVAYSLLCAGPIVETCTCSCSAWFSRTQPNFPIWCSEGILYKKDCQPRYYLALRLRNGYHAALHDKEKSLRDGTAINWIDNSIQEHTSCFSLSRGLQRT